MEISLNVEWFGGQERQTSIKGMCVKINSNLISKEQQIWQI